MSENNKMDTGLSRAGSLVIVVDAALFLHRRAVENLHIILYGVDVP